MTPPGPLAEDASVLDLFLALVAVPSPSGHERPVAELIQSWLARAGVESALDGAGAAADSDAGNLIATVPGAPGAPVYLFVAHMDTVESGSPPVRPRVGADDVIRSAGDTILGADNKAAVAAAMRLCAATAALPADGRPTVHVAFTCREESGRMGVGLLDPALLAGVDCAFCVDGSRPIGTVITRALGQRSFAVEIRGRTAHAAANPEAGVNAIRVAAEIVAALPHGRLPGGGSANVAAIIGGAALDELTAATLLAAPTNSVPDRALVRGEVRGFTVAEIEQTMAAISAAVQRVCAAHGADHAWLGDPGRMVPPFPGAGPRALARVRQAAGAVPGIALVEEQRHATLEANYLAAATDVVAVASGGRDPHQLSESIPVAELQRLEALLTAIVTAPDGPPG